MMVMTDGGIDGYGVVEFIMLVILCKMCLP